MGCDVLPASEASNKYVAVTGSFTFRNFRRGPVLKRPSATPPLAPLGSENAIARFTIALSARCAHLSAMRNNTARAATQP
eukprot:4404517-Prymnesium_polylepis.2